MFDSAAVRQRVQQCGCVNGSATVRSIARCFVCGIARDSVYDSAAVCGSVRQ